MGYGRNFRQYDQFVHMDDPLGRKDRFVCCMRSAEVLARAYKRFLGVIVSVFGLE